MKGAERRWVQSGGGRWPETPAQRTRQSATPRGPTNKARCSGYAAPGARAVMGEGGSAARPVRARKRPAAASVVGHTCWQKTQWKKARHIMKWPGQTENIYFLYHLNPRARVCVKVPLNKLFQMWKRGYDWKIGRYKHCDKLPFKPRKCIRLLQSKPSVNILSNASLVSRTCLFFLSALFTQEVHDTFPLSNGPD